MTAAARVAGARREGARVRVFREAVFDPFENDMGENSLQRFISEGFRPTLEAHVGEQLGPTFVGADQYIAWDPEDKEKVLSPDIYVLPGVPPGEDFDYWRVWQTGIVPSFALEIVSKRKAKDYKEVPPLYGELGVDELIIFDPRFKKRRPGFRFQVYRRNDRGGFVRVEETNADRVRSSVLRCWIRAVGDGKEQRLRLAADPAGDVLIPTAAEKAASRIAARDAEIAARDAEIAALRAELARRDRKR